MDTSPNETPRETLAPASPGDTTLRIAFDIAYDGTNFHGWAAQKNGLRTVEGHITEALTTITRQPVKLVVAGRTDAGVHATGQVAHCDIPAAALETRSLAGDPAHLVRRLARLTDPDVRITTARAVSSDFDARFSALSRSYTYRVTANPGGALPTRRFDTAAIAAPLRPDVIASECASIIGLHDFAAYSKHRDGATTVRNVTDFTFHDVSTPTEPATFEFRITADAFTWSMVRSLVGAALTVGTGRNTPGFMAEQLALRSRSPYVPVAAACGLTLTRVDYPADDELAARAAQTRGVRTLPGEEHRAVGKGCPETNPHYYGVRAE